MATVNIPSTIDDPNYRYKMPRVKARIEGRGNGIKTNIVNMGDIARALKRPPDYPTKFCGCELGSASKFESAEGKAIVNGAHTEPDLQVIIDKFVDRFVLCPQCRLPEVDLRVSKGRVQGACNACGFSGDMDNGHKVGTYIVNHPPDGAVSTMGGKKPKKGDKRTDKHHHRGGGGGGEDEELSGGSNTAQVAAVEPQEVSSSSKHKKSSKEHKSTSSSKHKSSKSSKSSKSPKANDENVQAVTALDFDSPEIEVVIGRLDEFIHRAPKPTPKDFFEEVRLLQVSQDFGPVMRVYVTLFGLCKRALTESKPVDISKLFSNAETTTYLRSICDRSVSGSMVLDAFEEFVNRADPTAFQTGSFGKLCHELYAADVVDEEDFIKRYGEKGRSTESGGGEIIQLQFKAAGAAAAFVRWLAEAESASDSE